MNENIETHPSKNVSQSYIQIKLQTGVTRNRFDIPTPVAKYSHTIQDILPEPRTYLTDSRRQLIPLSQLNPRLQNSSSRVSLISDRSKSRGNSKRTLPKRSKNKLKPDPQREAALSSFRRLSARGTDEVVLLQQDYSKQDPFSTFLPFDKLIENSSNRSIALNTVKLPESVFSNSHLTKTSLTRPWDGQIPKAKMKLRSQRPLGAQTR
jgi:hypothetical protein